MPDPSDYNDIMKATGISLSRLIRYGYGGFLLLIGWALISPNSIANLRQNMGDFLIGLSVFVIGAGIYILHRTLIIPLHHLILSFFMFKCKASPIRIMKDNYNVPFFRRMMAYTILRRADFFKNKDGLDIAHAEGGMLIMTGTACIIMGLYLWFSPSITTNKWPYIIIGILAFVASFVWAREQHTVEGLYILKHDETATKLLDEAGLLPKAASTPPTAPERPTPC